MTKPIPESLAEMKHTFEKDNLFCTVCGVNRLYWNTRFKTTWCKPKPTQAAQILEKKV